MGGLLQAWDTPDAEDITLNGTLKSANCGILVRISASTTHIAAYYAKAVNYTLMITAVSFIQVGSFACYNTACMAAQTHGSAISPFSCGSVSCQLSGSTCYRRSVQVLLLIRQIEATATTGSAARISVLCIGQQAIMDAYLCLLHLTTGACQLECRWACPSHINL